jgi:hypothetical protein
MDAMRGRELAALIGTSALTLTWHYGASVEGLASIRLNAKQR